MSSAPLRSSRGIEQYWSRGSDQGLRERTEADLRQRYLAHLIEQDIDVYRHGIQPPDGSVLWTDLYDPQRDEPIEAKSNTSRRTIRQAIGQLLDYRR